MNSRTSTAIVVLLTAAIGLTALTPAAFAQDQAKPQLQEHKVNELRQGPGGMRGGLLDLVCSDRGSEQLEIAFVRIAHRVDLTDAQKTLLDDLKTSALSAQTDFAATCAATLPDKTADAAQPTIVDRLQDRVAIETAHAAALTTVLPKLEAFFDSLSDEQKAAFQPQHRQMGNNDGPKGPMGFGKHLGPKGQVGPGVQMDPGAPGGPQGMEPAEPSADLQG